ncbi:MULTISPECIES: sporulation-delaying protein SdpB family protein [Bacillus]|uniref:sporulation-delaying protein SdpB family protein n=1 Tax=Bacillus TaxID=1386 RepID=UPI00187AF945|nr:MULTISPECIES: sporulation-delaying protein SdpB family protein [Bacillus cereus group]MBE7135329.1 hypothetical protein [Bacillus paranthracis]MBE7151918.1 hypothetical protein [Bacillus paranthracis]MCC2375559.1 hypothetical protein [Bacillus paranthracis]MCX3322843.1 hypothetical protein [Bacillus paranthracis]MDA1745573.1 hypothetical protein [Bacillus cereus group sp. LD121LC]
MLENLNNKLQNKLSDFNPWTNVYGFCRSLIGFATLVTLLFNDISIFLRPVAGVEKYPFCTNSFSLFCLVPNDYLYLNLLKWACILILVLVVIGWRPRFTGVLHYYILYSIQNAATSIDGGEQIGTVITLLLIPITLLDSRKWHWENIKGKEDVVSVYKNVTVYCVWMAIRFQMCFLYASAAITRLKNIEWKNGTALYYFFNDAMLGLPDGLKSILEPILTSWLVVIPTWGTTIVELLLFAALFTPKKHWKYYLYLGISLHAGIALFLGLFSFSLIMIGCLILYLHPINKPLSFKKSKKRLKVLNEKIS